MVSGKETILVTGGNGFLGVAVTLEALNAGYRVVSAVRRQDAADQISNVAHFKPYIHDGSLVFRIIPDITIPDAFVDAAKECISIIHLASPLPLRDFGDLTGIAVGGTIAVLNAANENPSVKRVVITSSIYAMKTWEQHLPDHPDNEAAMAGNFDDLPLMTGKEMVPNFAPSSTVGGAAFHRYAASKVAARNAVFDYLKLRNPHFNVVQFMPGYVFGPAITCRTKLDWFNTTNALLGFMFQATPAGIYYGFPQGTNAPIATWTCHVDDCASAHVVAIAKDGLFDSATAQCKEYLILSNGPHGPRWSDTIDIVKNDLPEVAKDIPFASTLDSIPQNFDSSPVEKELLGRKLLPYVQQVKDAITHWHKLPMSV